MPLSDLQRRCATIILHLPEAAGVALAGGAALLVHEVTDRGTNDLDCFGPSVAAVDILAPAAIEALTSAGLDVDVVVMASGFAKLVVVDGSERTQVDLGFDPATNAAVLTSVGPVRSLADLAETSCSRSSPVRRHATSLTCRRCWGTSHARKCSAWQRPRIEDSRPRSWPPRSGSCRRTTEPMNSHRCRTASTRGSWLRSQRGRPNFGPGRPPPELTHSTRSQVCGWCQEAVGGRFVAVTRCDASHSAI